MAEPLGPVTEGILMERFGRECIVALATVSGGRPYARNITAVYDGGAFYFLTYTPSEKMDHIAANPAVAIAGKWFSALGEAKDLGSPWAPGNEAHTAKLEEGLSAWWQGGKDDPRLRLVQVQLSAATIYDHDAGVRYDVDFTR